MANPLADSSRVSEASQKLPLADGGGEGNMHPTLKALPASM